MDMGHVIISSKSLNLKNSEFKNLTTFSLSNLLKFINIQINCIFEKYDEVSNFGNFDIVRIVWIRGVTLGL